MEGSIDEPVFLVRPSMPPHLFSGPGPLSLLVPSAPCSHLAKSPALHSPATSPHPPATSLWEPPPPRVCEPSTLTSALHTHSRAGNHSAGTGGVLRVGIYLAAPPVLCTLARECVLLECRRALVGTWLVSQCPVSLEVSADSRVPGTGLHLSSACSSHSAFLRGV